MVDLHDVDLAAALTLALQNDSSLPMTILVDVTGGVVTLEGHVRAQRERTEAEALARRFRNVKDVINRIVLNDDAPADLEG